MLQSFRAECLRSLGFDGFFHEYVNDTQVAFLIPPSYYKDNAYNDLITYLQCAFERYKLRTTVHVFETGTYISREYHQYTFGPHILFDMEYDDALPKPPILLKPCVDNWTIVEVPLKCGHSFLYEAAYPQDFMDTAQRLQAMAREMEF